MNNFSKQLKNLRKTRKLSLRDVAKKAKISNPYLCQLENGVRNPSLKILSILSSFYNITFKIYKSEIHFEEGKEK